MVKNCNNRGKGAALESIEKYLDAREQERERGRRREQGNFFTRFLQLIGRGIVNLFFALLIAFAAIFSVIYCLFWLILKSLQLYGLVSIERDVTQWYYGTGRFARRG